MVAIAIETSFELAFTFSCCFSYITIQGIHTKQEGNKKFSCIIVQVTHTQILELLYENLFHDQNPVVAKHRLNFCANKTFVISYWNRNPFSPNQLFALSLQVIKYKDNRKIKSVVRADDA